MVDSSQYDTVWQKLLMEEAEEKAREAEQLRLADLGRAVETRQLGYDLGSLPDPGVTSPRLGYDVGSLNDYAPAQGMVTNRGEGYGDNDITVNGSPERTVYAPYDCVLRRVGWENPQNHSQGYGYRAYCDRTDGQGGTVVGHMEPGSIPEAGTLIGRDEAMGRYGDPTNGRSRRPHLHRGEYDRTGRLIQPNLPSPFRRSGQRTSPYGPRWGGMHRGEDWVE